MTLIIQLFTSFFWVGIFCIGGGYASVPLIQHQVITIHQWLTMSEFMDIFAISQMTPGPIGINAATFVGTRVAGLPGSIAATLGFCAPSVIIMLILGYIIKKYGDVGAVRGILNGLRPAVVALIGGAAILFICMSLFGVDKIAIDPNHLKYVNIIIMIVCYVIISKKLMGVIGTLAFSGVLSLILNAVVSHT